MAEMWTRLPIMQGKVEQDQLTKIQKLCGGINPTTWPDVHKLPLYEKMTFPNDVKNAKRILTTRLSPFIKDANALDLIEKLLTLKPQDRINCDNALNHDFFWTDPMPEALTRTLSRIDKSMFEYLVTNPQAVRLKNEKLTKTNALSFRTNDQLHAYKITCMIVFFNLPFIKIYY